MNPSTVVRGSKSSESVRIYSSVHGRKKEREGGRERIKM